MADGVLPAPEQPEPGGFSSVAYPLWGAESLAVIVVLGAVYWVLCWLVPEYCLAAMGDAERMGATEMGWLVSLISALPAALLLPLFMIYGLQYLGRVLVSSAMGETTPPRTPDRNFDGLFNGLSPWLIWLVLGVGAGLLPMVYYLYSRGSISSSDGWTALGLFLLGLPYILMALLLSFLHDDPFAATPWRVAGSLLRAGRSFWLVCAFVVAAMAVGVATFALALLLRPSFFWLYLLVCLPCWIILQWIIIVNMRSLGLYYFHRKDILRWHRVHPRWGIAWRL
jgi:hypothetical protein